LLWTGLAPSEAETGVIQFKNYETNREKEGNETDLATNIGRFQSTAKICGL